MRVVSRKTRAISDTNLFNSQQLRNDLKANGWTENRMRRDNGSGLSDEPFLVFHREISAPNFGSVLDLSTSKSKTPFLACPETLEKQGVQGVLATGASPPMGYPIARPPHPSTDVEVVGGGVPHTVVTSLSDITTIQRMRSTEKSFVIGFDTEFYYDSGGTRNILSWQFAFILPDKPDMIQELLVFGCDNQRTLPFSYILNYIIEEFGVYASMSPTGSNRGFSYYRTHRWRVPVVKKNGLIKSQDFKSYGEALQSCCNPKVEDALKKIGMWKKADVIYTETPSGIETNYSYEVDGYPIGYLNVYSEADKEALPVTLVCHTGTADISTLDFENQYEKDMLLRLSNIQGGLMTLKPYYMHNPVLSYRKNFYPVRLSVRDTMGFAPSKKKSLKSLGDTIGIPKLDVQKPFSKNDMLSYMLGDVISFSEYAINDSVIALIYSAELWGVNTEMPITVSSAAGKASVPVIKEHFGLSESDNDAYNIKYRGLKRVGRGKVQNPKNFGFLDDSSLEPFDINCEIFQIFAKNAYKGGYNGCSAVGYYDITTNDFDLENAYPTCMSLVPDIDWENCVSMEFINTKLTPMMVRTPFDPVFAFIDFKFPPDVKYPCIPITVDGSMIYPLSNADYGGVYASAPELYLAMRLGAEITVRRLIIANVLMDGNGNPSHSLFSVVKQFINDRNIAKAVFSKGSLADLLLKEAANSIYGKTAQDVIDKSSWSASSETMENIGASLITSPYHAAMTTAGVRCVLLSAMNQIENLGYKVYSVTTDGFITNCDLFTLENLDLFGFTRLFQTARMMLVGDPTMWAIKHSQNDLVNLTTRGNASLVVGDKNTGLLAGVMAHNSFVTGKEPDSYEDRYSFITQVLSRTGKLRTVNASFVKFKEMARRENRLDFAVHEQERMISMDFDLKRKPVESSLRDVRLKINMYDYDIANFDTVPYETIAEYQFYKSTGRNMTVLRSYKDWVLYFDKIKGKKDGKKRIITDLDWSVLFSAVMAYRLQIPLEKFNMEPAKIPFLDNPDRSVDEKIEFIQKFNRSKKVFSANTWKDCRKQQRISQMLPEPLYIDMIEDMMFWDDDAVHEIDYTDGTHDSPDLWGGDE